MITDKELIYLYSEDCDYDNFYLLSDTDLLRVYDLFVQKKILFNPLSAICLCAEILSRGL